MAAGLTSRQIKTKIEADGWVLKRVQGSHHIFGHPTRPGIVVLPHPKKDMAIGTVRSIEKQSGVKLL